MTSQIALVSMPFAPPQRPSLALSILKAILTKAQISTSVHYPCLWFAESLGFDLHEVLSKPSCELALMEWIFAPLAFPETSRDDAQFIERFLLRHPSFPIRNVFRLSAIIGRARKTGAQVLDRALDAVLAESPSIVGCTSMFQQHVASLALLRRVKQARPNIVTMMGGPNCETRMGQATHKNYPWVDYIVSGEAEELIVPLVRGVLSSGKALPAELVPFGAFAPIHRETAYPAGKGGDGVPRASVGNFDCVPLPDYQDFFSSLAELPSRERIVACLPIETSRGCWWGAQSHCTFCGLNGTSMAYRSKSPERVVTEICELHDRYGVENMDAVDNIIDIRYFDTVLPELAHRAVPVRLFYETKSNLKRRHLQAARAANVIMLQPGIESLNSAALKHMGKGVQAWQNIQFLRFASEEGIRTYWTNLIGFPGDDDGWYAGVADIIPLLAHLEPGGFTRVRYDRYSPLFNGATERGAQLRPYEGYQHVYPVRGDALFEQTYFFEDADPLQEDDTNGWTAPPIEWKPGARRLLDAVRAWRQLWVTRIPVLAMIDGDGILRIEDDRPLAKQASWSLRGLERAVMLAADDALPEHRLLDELSASTGFTREQVADAVDMLLSARLLLRIDGRLLALPTLGCSRLNPLDHLKSPLGLVLPRGATANVERHAAQ